MTSIFESCLQLLPSDYTAVTTYWWQSYCPSHCDTGSRAQVRGLGRQNRNHCAIFFPLFSQVVQALYVTKRQYQGTWISN